MTLGEATGVCFTVDTWVGWVTCSLIGVASERFPFIGVMSKPTSISFPSELLELRRCIANLSQKSAVTMDGGNLGWDAPHTTWNRLPHCLFSTPVEHESSLVANLGRYDTLGQIPDGGASS